MRGGVSTLVCALALFSLFNTTEADFRFWDSPDINTNSINSPNIPVSFKSDISLFGLFINFFSNHEFNLLIKDDIIIDVKSKTIDIVNPIINSKVIVIPKNNVYGIQFAVLDVYLDYFPGIDYFETYIKNGLVHYIIDDFPSISSAKQKMYALRELGYTDAFVFTFNNNKRECYFIVRKEGPYVNSLSLFDKEDISNFDDDLVVKNLTNNELIKTEIKELAEIDRNEVDELNNLVEDDGVNKNDVVKSSIVNKKVIKKDFKGNVKYSLDNDEYPIKSDEQVIFDSPFIKENAKDLIFKSIENGTIVVNDVEELLFKHVGEMIKKKHVKELIKSKR